MNQEKVATCKKECYFLVSGKKYQRTGNFCRESLNEKYKACEEPLNFLGAFPGFPCERQYTESQLAERIEKAKKQSCEVEGEVFPQEHGIPPIPRIKHSIIYKRTKLT